MARCRLLNRNATRLWKGCLVLKQMCRLCSTLMKLSVSFLQVWQGAVCTLTTVSSDRSTTAGRKDQVHHMVLLEKMGLGIIM